MPKRQVMSGSKGKSSTLSIEHVTRPPVPDLIQTKLINVGMKVRKSVSEGYKVKQTIFPTNNTVPIVDTTTPTLPKKTQLKRSRSENEEVEEHEGYTSVPKLVVSSSFNSFANDEDWEEPDWLLPKEIVCEDVEMKEAN